MLLVAFKFAVEKEALPIHIVLVDQIFEPRSACDLPAVALMFDSFEYDTTFQVNLS